MLGQDPRHTEHRPSVQQIPPTYNDPRKRLSHAIKYSRSKPSGGVSGTVVPILKRATLGLRRRKG